MILRGSVYSKTLEMETGITIITPPTGTGGVPQVAYILHGLCGSNGNWTDNSLLPVYARDYNAVMVMPEVGRSFYTDMKYGQRFFCYVADELPAIVAAAFRVSAKREDTAVIGGSMGGYGALKVALSRPDFFGRCGALSSACLYLKPNMAGLRTPEGRAYAREQYGEQLLRDFEGAFGPGFEWSEGIDILELAKKVSPADRPRIFCACGADDDLKSDNRRMAADLGQLGYDVAYEEPPGGHDWYFFDKALKKALDFCLTRLA